MNNSECFEALSELNVLMKKTNNIVKKMNIKNHNDMILEMNTYKVIETLRSD